MGAPVNKMLRAMQAFFLADPAIANRIALRMHRNLSQQRIVAHERPDSTIGTKLGQFVEYDLSGEDRILLVNRKSMGSFANVDFRFFGRYPADAAELYDAFWDRLGSTNRYSGTWADDTDDETKVLGARFVDGSASDEWDSTIGMAVVTVTLFVPYVVT